MISKPIVVPQIIVRSLKEKVKDLLEHQPYTNSEKLHYLKGFQSELSHKLVVEGLTNENLLLGLELNNYIEQISEPSSKLHLQQVTYTVN